MCGEITGEGGELTEVKAGRKLEQKYRKSINIRQPSEVMKWYQHKA